VTHDDGVELTFDNIVNDSSLCAYTAVMCWIESNRNIFSESEFSSMQQRLFTTNVAMAITVKPGRYTDGHSCT